MEVLVAVHDQTPKCRRILEFVSPAKMGQPHPVVSKTMDVGCQVQYIPWKTFHLDTSPHSRGGRLFSRNTFSLHQADTKCSGKTTRRSHAQKHSRYGAWPDTAADLLLSRLVPEVRPPWAALPLLLPREAANDFTAWGTPHTQCDFDHRVTCPRGARPPTLNAESSSKSQGDGGPASGCIMRCRDAGCWPRFFFRGRSLFRLCLPRQSLGFFA